MVKFNLTVFSDSRKKNYEELYFFWFDISKERCNYYQENITLSNTGDTERERERENVSIASLLILTQKNLFLSYSLLCICDYTNSKLYSSIASFPKLWKRKRERGRERKSFSGNPWGYSNIQTLSPSFLFSYISPFSLTLSHSLSTMYLQSHQEDFPSYYMFKMRVNYHFKRTLFSPFFSYNCFRSTKKLPQICLLSFGFWISNPIQKPRTKNLWSLG